MIRVAIIGCGKVADQHAVQIQRIPGAQIVAVCDVETLMAQQMAERFEVRQTFTDVSQMLEDSRHINPPPHSGPRACLSQQLIL